MESLAYSHFGSASYFIICDTENGDVRVLRNGDEHHVHGACLPLKALGGETVEAVIVGGIGGRAIAGLNSLGIKVYQCAPGTVRDNIDLFKRNMLPEWTPDQACSHHRHGEE